MIKIAVYIFFILFKIALFYQMYYLENIIKKEQDKNLLNFEKDNIFIA